MVGHFEYEKVYNLFDPSSHKTFIERSAQFEEEHMQEVELVEGEYSHRPLNVDESDVSINKFYNYDMEADDDEMHLDHDSPTRPKRAAKTIQ